MTQTEFIDTLRVCLTGKVSVGTVQDNISYYRQYFSEQLRNGKSEEEICDALGSPQIIAKGILEAEKFQMNNQTDYGQEVDEEKDFRRGTEKFTQRVREFHLPAWLMGIIRIILFFVVVDLVLTVFSALAPIILPICIVLFVLHIFKNNFQYNAGGTGHTSVVTKCSGGYGMSNQCSNNQNKSQNAQQNKAKSANQNKAQNTQQNKSQNCCNKEKEE